MKASGGDGTREGDVAICGGEFDCQGKILVCVVLIRAVHIHARAGMPSLTSSDVLWISLL